MNDHTEDAVLSASPFFGVEWSVIEFGVWLATLVTLFVIAVKVRQRWAWIGSAGGVAVVATCLYFLLQPIEIMGRENSCWNVALGGAVAPSRDACWEASQWRLAWTLLLPVVYLLALVVWRTWSVREASEAVSVQAH